MPERDDDLRDLLAELRQARAEIDAALARLRDRVAALDAVVDRFAEVEENLDG